MMKRRQFMSVVVGGLPLIALAATTSDTAYAENVCSLIREYVRSGSGGQRIICIFATPPVIAKLRGQYPADLPRLAPMTGYAVDTHALLFHLQQEARDYNPSGRAYRFQALNSDGTLSYHSMEVLALKART